MTDLQLVSALMLAVACLATYLAGRLLERDVRIKEKDGLISELSLTVKAYQNRAVESTGDAPIFNEQGIVLSKPAIVNDNTPVQFIRPPFAQAEADWEAEEEVKQRSLAANFGIQVPPLSEEAKERIKQTYPSNGLQ